MRRNKLIKTEEENIYTCETKSGDIHYYLNFELNNKRYQRKNITKLYKVKNLKDAVKRLGAIVIMIEEGEDPFSSNTRKETVKDFIINQIENKKPNSKGKNNANYKRSLEVFYYKYLDDVIGHLKFEKIRKEHITKILNSMNHLSSDRQGLIKVLLYNEFETRFRKREIEENFLYKVNFGPKSKKIKLEIRLNEDIESIAKKLYATIIESSYRTKLLLLINLMCVRRIGEIYDLKYKDINIDDKGNYFVLAYPDITKTGIYEKYPLPKEVIKLLPADILDVSSKDQKLCKFHKNTIYLNYHRLVKDSKIKLNIGFKMTSHDSRNIFITLLVKKGFDSSIADASLSHSISDTKGIYLEVDYETRSGIFEEYWKILRS